jgi:uncharacterized protein
MAPVPGPRSMMLAAAVAIVSSALPACEDQKAVYADVAPVKIAGRTFHLELALDEPTRMKGLGGRSHIEEDGGMLFVFPPGQVRVQSFIMRDCPIDIDIIYCDGAGRVLTTYTMKKEEPRKADGSEGKEGDLNNVAYETRLARYSSRFPSQFVIELKAGTIQKLGVKEGDLITFDATGLKRRAK